MATLQDYLGITSLRDAWPKWKANVVAVNNQVINHVAGTADKHAAQDVTYSGNEDGVTAKAAIDNVHTRVDTIVAGAGASNTEILDARGTYPILKDRLDGSDSQLANNAKQIFKNDMVVHRERKPLITIIDDDGRPEVYTILKPLSEQYNIPITSAVITSRVGDISLSMSLEQLKEIETVGIEIVSHSHTHVHLADLTEDEIDIDLKASSKWMLENGFSIDTMVIPFGSVDEIVEKVTRRYFRSGVHNLDNLGGINYPPLITFRLQRTSDTKTIEELKVRVDETIANNGWLIIMTHCSTVGFDIAKIEALIQYAQLQNLEFSTIKNALNTVGNIVDIPSKTGLITLGVDGVGTLKDYVNSYTLREYVTINSPISDFPIGKSATYYYGGHLNGGGFPTATSGILETYRGSDDYNYQDYIPYQTIDVYRRFWNDNTKVWSLFKLVITTIPAKPTPINLTLTGGWTGTMSYLKNTPTNLVSLVANITAGSSALTQSAIATLPFGFKPSQIKSVLAWNHTQQKIITGFVISNGGAIDIKGAVDGTIIIGDSIRIDVVFLSPI